MKKTILIVGVVALLMFVALPSISADAGKDDCGVKPGSKENNEYMCVIASPNYWAGADIDIIIPMMYVPLPGTAGGGLWIPYIPQPDTPQTNEPSPWLPEDWGDRGDLDMEWYSRLPLLRPETIPKLENE